MHVQHPTSTKTGWLAGVRCVCLGTYHFTTQYGQLGVERRRFTGGRYGRQRTLRLYGKQIGGAVLVGQLEAAQALWQRWQTGQWHSANGNHWHAVSVMFTIYYISFVAILKKLNNNPIVHAKQIRFRTISIGLSMRHNTFNTSAHKLQTHTRGPHTQSRGHVPLNWNNLSKGVEWNSV